MSFQEKKSLVYMVSTLMLSAIYAYYSFVIYPDRSLSLDTDFKFYGLTILLLVPAMILINIINHIIFYIINKIQTGQEEMDVADELDKSINFRADRNAYATFMVCFLLSMVPLLLEWPVYLMFNILVLGVMAASLVWSSSNIYFYRKGLV